MGEVVFREQAPFRKMDILHDGGEETKAKFIIAMVTHHPESMEHMAELVRKNNVKTLILEDSPKSLMEVIEGKKTAQAHVREFILKETNGEVDLEKNPDAYLLPRLASYKRRCELLEGLKRDMPDLKIVILDPYYNKDVLGPRGETYEERMKLERGISDDVTRMQYAMANRDFRGALEHAKDIAKNIAKQISTIDEMRANAIADGSYAGNVLVEAGEGHISMQKNLERNLKDNPVSVMLANKRIMEKVFKADENFYPPLLQLAHQYITKGDAIDKNSESLLAARACAAAINFEQESERLLKEGKRMNAQKDYELIKAANSLSFDDCKKISIG